MPVSPLFSPSLFFLSGCFLCTRIRKFQRWDSPQVNSKGHRDSSGDGGWHHYEEVLQLQVTKNCPQMLPWLMDGNHLLNAKEKQSCSRDSTAVESQGKLWERLCKTLLLKVMHFLNFLFYIWVEPINNVVIVSGAQQSDSVVHIHVPILPQTPLPSRLPHNTEQNSLCYTVGLCWLPILNIAAHTCQSQSP